MNLHIVNIIIKREYLTRVKKMSFIITTFLVPILFAALCMLPSLIMLMAKEEAKKIAVVDQSGIVMPFLKDTETTTFKQFGDVDPDMFKRQLDSVGMDALLVISPLDTASRTVTAVSYASKPLGMDMTEAIQALLDIFRKRGIRYVWACCFRENSASERLIRRCGFSFVQEGVFFAPGKKKEYASMEFCLELDPA